MTKKRCYTPNKVFVEVLLIYGLMCSLPGLQSHSDSSNSTALLAKAKKKVNELKNVFSSVGGKNDSKALSTPKDHLDSTTKAGSGTSTESHKTKGHTGNDHMNDKQTSIDRNLEILSMKDAHCDSTEAVELDLPLVYLTVSAKGRVSWLGHIEARRIVMHWELPKDYGDEDWIGLFEKDISKMKSVKDSEALEYLQVKDLKSKTTPGQHYCKESLGYQNMTLKKACLGFWIGYARKNKVLKSNCLKTEPHWMEDSKDVISEIPLTRLMIPGTHNSGSIKQFTNYFSDNILNRYSINQEESLWNQLIMGIRFLDIRVHFKRKKEKFYLTHNKMIFEPLKKLVSTVKRFVEQTEELVILSFHRFLPKGMSKEKEKMVHKELHSFLEHELAGQLFPHNALTEEKVTAKQCWELKRRVILSYKHRSQNSNALFWPGVKHFWNETSTTVKDLHAFLNKTMETLPREQLSASMAHISFYTSTVLKDAIPIDFVGVWKSGIRRMTDKLNKQMGIWFRYNWWQKTNIVATDFFLSNNLIEESKRVNYRRFVCKTYLEKKKKKKKKATKGKAGKAGKAASTSASTTTSISSAEDKTKTTKTTTTEKRKGEKSGQDLNFRATTEKRGANSTITRKTTKAASGINKMTRKYKNRTVGSSSSLKPKNKLPLSTRSTSPSHGHSSTESPAPAGTGASKTTTAHAKVTKVKSKTAAIHNKAKSKGATSSSKAKSATGSGKTTAAISTTPKKKKSSSKVPASSSSRSSSAASVNKLADHDALSPSSDVTSAASTLTRSLSVVTSTRKRMAITRSPTKLKLRSVGTAIRDRKDVTTTTTTTTGSTVASKEGQ